MKKFVIPYPTMLVFEIILLIVDVSIPFFAYPEFVFIKPWPETYYIDLFFSTFLFLVFTFFMVVFSFILIYGYFFMFQPIHFCDHGIRRGKIFIAWDEITAFGLADLFSRQDLEHFTNLPYKNIKYIFLAVGKPTPGIWTNLGVSGVWEYSHGRSIMPYFYRFYDKYLSKYLDAPRICFYEESDFPEKMVWFKYDEKLYYECVKRIKQRECQGDGSLDTTPTRRWSGWASAWRRISS